MTGACREVLTERTVVRVDARALWSLVRLDVRGRVGTRRSRLQLRIGKRRDPGAQELDQRDSEREEPRSQRMNTHCGNGDSGERMSAQAPALETHDQAGTLVGGWVVGYAGSG
jgi:hypothetical protein